MPGVIPDLIRATAATNEARVALVVDGAGRHTYQQLVARADTISAGLRARGVRRGDLIALLFPAAAWLDYACALLGVLDAGAVLVSGGATEDEVRQMAGHHRLRAVLTAGPGELPGVADWHSDLATVEAQAAGAPRPPGAGLRPDDLAMILHPPGTARRVTGVPLTHADLAAPAVGMPPKADPAVAERVLTSFPVASAAGPMHFAREVGGGNTLYLMPEFEPGRFRAIVEHERIERVSLAPAMGEWLARAAGPGATLTSPRSVTFSAAPLPAPLLDDMHTLFPHARLENRYSSAGLVPTLVTTVLDPDRPGAAGTAPPQARNGRRAVGLERRPDEVAAPWSYQQEYLWAAKERWPNPGGNVLLSLRLRGPLDVTAVREALEFLVARHEILRTRLTEAGQVVDAPGAIELPVTDLPGSRLNRSGRTAPLTAIARAQHRICLDLRHGPTFVPQLVRLAVDEHVLMLTMDHASCDGWSAGILLREFAAAYGALAAGTKPDLPPLPVRYRDFAADQREQAAAGGFGADLGYWELQLAGLPAEAVLPRRAGAPAWPGYRGAQRALELGPPLARAVRKLAGVTGRTVSGILLGALVASLGTISGRSDVAVATLTPGRSRPELRGVVGMLANPLLLRAAVGGPATADELFGAVQTAAAAAQDHGTVPFPLVAELAGPSAGRPEVWFAMAPPPMEPVRAASVIVEPSGLPRSYPIEIPASAWRGKNLMVNGVDTGDSIHLDFDWNTELVDAGTIGRLRATYLDLLRAATS